MELIKRALNLLSEVDDDEFVVLKDIEHANNITLIKLNDDGDFIAVNGMDLNEHTLYR